ncbi:MAG TPA: flagellin [Gammaproteobacteria bacterium]|nr:flagellin [Gammaproteobacteria bacterium]
MSQVINTNVMSLNAQRNLSTSGGQLAQSLQRLSSGLRINSAKDDAAGLAISERMTTQIRGMNQAIRNSNDGISLAQTAEGALAEVANNLQRIRELAVQARNASNSDSDRAALDAEVQQRIAEISRVAGQTEFNGLKLLDGSFTAQVFQVGANYGQTISVDSIAAVTAQALGLNGGTLIDYNVTGTAPTAALAAGDLTINDVDIGAADRDAKSIADAINSASTGVTAEAQSNSVTGAALTAGTVSGLTINGVTVADTAVTADAAGAGLLADAINAALEGAGNTSVVASVSGTAVQLDAADGSNIVVGGTVANSGLTAATTYSTVNLTSAEAYTIGGNAPDSAGFTAGDAIGTSTSYTAINVLTAASADTVLRVIDDSLTTVNGSRADLGAVQNRFESVVANLSAGVENLSASRSRILDADFAAETASLTRAQVLQQAGVAMLAQANAMPQNVLQLLR